jgi:PLP dependent protein
MLKDNLKIVKENILNSVNNSGRELNEIRLIAISKTNPISKIIESLNDGLTDFGENKAVEFRDKSLLIKDKIIWHFVGHLQTNKVKYVIDGADFIHSVESFKLLEEINKRAKQIGKVQNILFEVNTSKEDSKFGLKNYDELSELALKCSDFSNIKPVGLMTMASFTNDEKSLRNSFSQLREFRDEIGNKINSIKELSMGMTNDYTIAIEEGATMLRIGTGIFGSRDVSLSWSEK